MIGTDLIEPDEPRSPANESVGELDTVIAVVIDVQMNNCEIILLSSELAT